MSIAALAGIAERDSRARESVIRCPEHKMLGAAMAWRQGQSYSEDLRARVLVAVDGGMAARAVASVFRGSVSYIYKALIRRRRTGEVSVSSRGGHRPRKLTPTQEAALASHITAHRDLGRVIRDIRRKIAGDETLRRASPTCWPWR